MEMESLQVRSAPVPHRTLAVQMVPNGTVWFGRVVRVPAVGMPEGGAKRTCDLDRTQPFRLETHVFNLSSMMSTRPPRWWRRLRVGSQRRQRLTQQHETIRFVFYLYEHVKLQQLYMLTSC